MRPGDGRGEGRSREARRGTVKKRREAGRRAMARVGKAQR